jgi:putative ABC transport system ATP-binding protein
MTEPVIEAIDTVKFLGDGAGRVQALKGVSLAVAGGELTLLMGPSGSGKTTLLSILGCMLTPTSGTVRVGGRATADAGPEELAKIRRDNIGFVFQSYHLFPTLTALDNVRLALDVRGENSHRATQKSKEALARVGLALKMASYPSELSGGEQQRVAIARAIVGNPAVLLADEPTAALDSENGHAIMEVLAEIAREQSRGVLVVTHDPRIVPFADRIVSIEDGKIMSDKRASDGEDKPATDGTDAAKQMDKPRRRDRKRKSQQP